MREFSRGIYMVLAAYVLSFFLLIIGSDTFYNIKSKAADGLNTQSDEVNKSEFSNENEGSLASHSITKTIDNGYQEENKQDEYYQNEYHKDECHKDEYHQVEYRLEYRQKYLQKYQNSVSDGEKVISSFSIADPTTDDLSKNEISLDRLSPTMEEVKMLEQIVEAEATGEDIIGKILVANVIFNRMEDEKFPDNVEDVIFQRDGDVYQFSPIADKRFWKVEVTKETEEAVQRAVSGEDYSDGALYFMARRLARKSSVKWFDNNLQWLFKHGDHEFYK